MILKYPHIIFIRENGHRSPINKLNPPYPIIECQCDKCGKIFIERCDVFDKRLELINLEYCGNCSRPLMSSLAGIKGTYNSDGTLKPNKGHFSSERVENMTSAEYEIFCEQRRKAASDFHKYLDDNPLEKMEYYDKIYKKSKIGYISTGQKEVFECVKDFGFELEEIVHGIRCDIINKETKTVIEYYGDLWHANPRTYNPDDYIKIIKMTAKEKWEKDKRRNFILRNNGYSIIIIWEDEWKNNRLLSYKKLEKLVSIDYKFPEWKPTETSRKFITDLKNKKYKTVHNAQVDEYIKNGWVLGRIDFRKYNETD